MALPPPADYLSLAPIEEETSQVTVPGEAQVLLSTKAKRKPRSKQDEPVDRIVASFLGFLERQMREHPERIRPLDAKLLNEIGELVKGIDKK
jgi:prlF antitoxin for toxin YhaV_toxin